MRAIEFVEPNGWKIYASSTHKEEKIDPAELSDPKRASRLFHRLSKTNEVIYRPDFQENYGYHLEIK